MKRIATLLLRALALSLPLLATNVNALEGPAAGNFPLVPLADLPREARETLALIHKGGPFPYSKDGVVFGNRERTLPAKPRGYYHEYTVKTPGSRNRGARRIVCGGDKRTPDNCYYSDDHYQSFRKIQE